MSTSKEPWRRDASIKRGKRKRVNGERDSGRMQQALRTGFDRPALELPSSAGEVPSFRVLVGGRPDLPLQTLTMPAAYFPASLAARAWSHDSNAARAWSHASLAARAWSHDTVFTNQVDAACCALHPKE